MSRKVMVTCDFPGCQAKGEYRCERVELFEWFLYAIPLFGNGAALMSGLVPSRNADFCLEHYRLMFIKQTEL